MKLKVLNGMTMMTAISVVYTLIWNAVICWPGSTHDARIINDSRLCEFMNENHEDNNTLLNMILSPDM